MKENHRTESKKNKTIVPKIVNKKIPMTDEIWEAIIQNDQNFDGIFFYGVSTTQIFCCPSCHSRVPNKENVHLFKYAEEALEKGFRPCKRRRPDRHLLPNEEWINHITQWIDVHYSEELTLNRVAELFHWSPYHLQRTFKRLKKISLNEYAKNVRISKAKEKLLLTNKKVSVIAIEVGFKNTAYFSTLFQKETGYTPTTYRKVHQ